MADCAAPYEHKFLSYEYRGRQERFVYHESRNNTLIEIRVFAIPCDPDVDPFFLTFEEMNSVTLRADVADGLSSGLIGHGIRDIMIPRLQHETGRRVVSSRLQTSEGSDRLDPVYAARLWKDFQARDHARIEGNRYVYLPDDAVFRCPRCARVERRSRKSELSAPCLNPECSSTF